MKKIRVGDMKQLGNKFTGTVNNMKYQLLTIGLLIYLIHYLNKLNKFHNP